MTWLSARVCRIAKNNEQMDALLLWNLVESVLK
jgi:hypothetical protein